jgi:hypothetical protein
VNAAYRELLAAQGSSAASRLRDEVTRELAQQHQRELDSLKEMGAAALAQQAAQLSTQVRRTRL